MASGTLELRRPRRKRGRCDAPSPRSRCGSSSKTDWRIAFGPDRGAPNRSVRLLAEHKREVIVAWLDPRDTARRTTGELSAAEAGYRQNFTDGAARREFDADYSRAGAEQLAFGEWHPRHGPPDTHRCAANCRAKGGLTCAIVPVHFDAIRRVDCIIAYGKRWRSAARLRSVRWGSIRRKVSPQRGLSLYE